MGKVCNFYFEIIKEEFEDTKGATRNHISKKSRQHNGQKKKYKKTNNDRKNIHINQRSSNTNPTKNISPNE
jgi:hypothetical protein